MGDWYVMHGSEVFDMPELPAKWAQVSPYLRKVFVFSTKEEAEAARAGPRSLGCSQGPRIPRNFRVFYGVETVERRRSILEAPLKPRDTQEATVKALLAKRAWKGSTTRREGAVVVVEHNSGAVARIFPFPAVGGKP